MTLTKSLGIFDAGHLPSDLKIAIRLKELIEENFRLEHSPEFYIRKVNRTVKAANAICRLYHHKTVYELIQDRIHDEAVKLLLHTSISVKEITYGLGICDPGWFAKSFRMRNGMNPRAFRNFHKLPNSN